MTCFLFPGQGSQKPGMGRDFYDASPAAREIFDRAAALLGAPFVDLIFKGPEDTLRETQNTQPALVAVESAIVAHLVANGLAPAAVAGHSIGEVAALVAANALSFEDALPLARERGRLMAGAMTGGAMAAVIGLAPDDIQAALPEGAEIANFNGPQQTIISGPADAVDHAIETLKQAGAKRVMLLNVSGAFHSSFMKPAATQFAEYLKNVRLTTPDCAFVSSVTGHEESDPDHIRNLLAQQLYEPVRWTQVMEYLGPIKAVETGPGNVLQGLARRTSNAPEIAPAGTLDQANLLVAQHEENPA